MGHACLEKSDEAVTDLAESEKTLGEKHACEDYDEAKLKQYKVDCEKVSKMIVGWAAEFECEVTVADQVLEQCETAGEDCKSGVDTGVKAWTLTKPDVSEGEQEEEEKEGFEALLGLIQECHKGSKDHFENPQGDDPVAAACSEENTDDLAAMGIDESHCKEYRSKQAIDFTTMVCTGWAMTNPPEGHDGEDISLEDIQTVVGNFFKLGENEVEGSSADRLRLYAASAVKAKRWPKLQPWSSKVAKFGGLSAVAASAVMVIIGMRRSRHVEAQDDHQMLMNIE